MRLSARLVAGGVLGLALALVLCEARPVSAIPAWARKYGMDCTGCHVAGFKLNRVGQDFLRSGHHVEGGKEEQNLSDYVSLAYKNRYTYSKTKQENDVVTDEKNTFEQHSLSVYTGGQLQKEWYYFAELYFHENSGKTRSSDDKDYGDFARSKLAEAYLQYINREAGEAYTSVRFGQITPYLLHIHGLGARLSQDRPFVINSGTVGSNPYKPFSRQYGLELSQYYKGFDVAAAVVNGTGGSFFNRVDNDLKKDGWATADYTFDDQGSMLGVYGYLGHYPVALDDPARYEGNSYDDFDQVGALGNYTRKEGALVGAVFAGRNEFNPKDVSAPDDTAKVESKSMGFYAELQVYALHPRVQPYVRYDFWDADTDKDDDEVMGPLVGISWRALDHGRLVAHFQQLKTLNPTSALEKTQNSFLLEANFMF